MTDHHPLPNNFPIQNYLSPIRRKISLCLRSGWSGINKLRLVQMVKTLAKNQAKQVADALRKLKSDPEYSIYDGVKDLKDEILNALELGDNSPRKNMLN